jgi:hypothetical protein
VLWSCLETYPRSGSLSLPMTPIYLCEVPWWRINLPLFSRGLKGYGFVTVLMQTREVLYPTLTPLSALLSALLLLFVLQRRCYSLRSTRRRRRHWCHRILGRARETHHGQRLLLHRYRRRPTFLPEYGKEIIVRVTLLRVERGWIAWIDASLYG